MRQINHSTHARLQPTGVCVCARVHGPARPRAWRDQERERRGEKINVNKRRGVGLAATPRSAGRDYLRDWISEEGLPKDPATHSSHTHTQGCVCAGGGANRSAKPTLTTLT